MSDFMLRQLCTDLTSDGTATTGYQNRLSFDISQNFIQIYFNRITSQKVFNLHISQLGDIDLTVHQLINTRNGLNLAVCLVTDFKNCFDILTVCGRHRQNNFINLVFFY